MKTVRIDFMEKTAEVVEQVPDKVIFVEVRKSASFAYLSTGKVIPIRNVMEKSEVDAFYKVLSYTDSETLGALLRSLKAALPGSSELLKTITEKLQGIDDQTAWIDSDNLAQWFEETVLAEVLRRIESAGVEGVVLDLEQSAKAYAHKYMRTIQLTPEYHIYVPKGIER